MALSPTSSRASTSDVGTDGFTIGNDSYAYASATTLTVVGVDRTSIFKPGTLIKLTNTTVKYFVVVSSSFGTDTTVTVTGGSDYSLANAAITGLYYSYQAGPAGFPAWFAYASGAAGWSAFTTNYARFSVVGRLCYVVVRVVGTSDATTATVALPIACAAATLQAYYAPTAVTNNGSDAAGASQITAASVLTFYTSIAGAAFTGSGTKAVQRAFAYEI